MRFANSKVVLGLTVAFFFLESAVVVAGALDTPFGLEWGMTATCA